MCDRDEDLPGDPVCYASSVVAGYYVDQETLRDVNRFRKAERSSIYDRRKKINHEERTIWTEALIENLTQVLEKLVFKSIAVYWPIRGEPDLRSVMSDLHRRGRKILLPVVVEKDAPLVFRIWRPGCRLSKGMWNIPVPQEDVRDIPEVIISPVVGIDEAFYRLGNGGGYYDRTLAAMGLKPLVIGVGFSFSEIPTIFPMPWDIRMDLFVSENSIQIR